jgi:hypothetical protein
MNYEDGGTARFCNRPSGIEQDCLISPSGGSFHSS